MEEVHTKFGKFGLQACFTGIIARVDEKGMLIAESIKGLLYLDLPLKENSLKFRVSFE